MEEVRPSEVLPREFLCCPLCHEEFQDPRYLSCLHSFCKSCIDGYKSTTSDNNISFMCPFCTTETVISDMARSELPANNFVRRLAGPLTIPGQRDRTCGQCELAGVSVAAKIHCINCDEFLCDKCALRHVDQEETSSHKTQQIENYQETVTTSPLGPTLARCCAFYDVLDIGSTFCVDCDMSLCADCHKKQHTDHRCAELSAISQNFENKIKDPLQELIKDKQSLQEQFTYLEDARQEAERKSQEVKNAVKQRTQVLSSLIQEYEAMLLLEIDTKHAQNLAMIREKEDAIRRHAESIGAVTELTEKLFMFGLEEEKVLMRRQVGRRVRELCETDLPIADIRLTNRVLSEPTVAVESICEMFGVLKTTSEKFNNRKLITGKQKKESGIKGRGTIIQFASSSYEILDHEEGEGEEAEAEEEDDDTDMLYASSTSDALRQSVTTLGENNANITQRHLKVCDTPQLDSSRQPSTSDDDVPCFNLDVIKKEMCFPDIISRDCIKGVGVNCRGDIIVGTVSLLEGSKVFLLEKHGIVRGQIPVEKNWLVHSIAADGKVSFVLPRSDNRYKVKIMSGENNVDILVDAHIESFGLNSLTATKSGILLVAASRYAISNPTYGRSAKYGGNVTMYAKDGSVLSIITNETLADIHPYLLDRPHTIATDHHGNFFVADPGRHSVLGFRANGNFMFEYGNTDAEEELYQGPDAVCADCHGNVIVFDKKDGRIDILDYLGNLQRCYFPCEHIRFVCVTPDRTLMLVNSVGNVTFFDYL